MDMVAPAVTDASARKPLYWVAPMDANYKRDAPGLSPMGMPLIPVYESSDTITVSPSIQQNLGLRTDTVVRENFAPDIQAVGYTNWDQSTIQVLHTRAEGWLEVFNLASEGDSVFNGDVLYELFSPALVSAQREYLSAIASNNASLGAVAKDRLLSLGFTSEQISALDATRQMSNRLSVRAVKDAVVTGISVREGSYVSPGTVLATFASLDSVWVEAEVFESLAGWIAPGQTAQITFAAFPGERWNSTVEYIYPSLDATSRSLRVRLIVENSNGRLLPGMFVKVSIEGVPKLDVLTVPREAVIRSGNGDRVMRALGEGRFKPVVVRTGISNGTRLEIVSGLEEGDVVVTSGQFLLDSEANGEQAFARLNSTDSDSSAMSSSMPMASTMALPTANAALFETSGEITQITAGVSVTLSHQAVEALSWPAMTMSFQLPSQTTSGQLTVGDLVDFSFRRTEQGSYEIVNIVKQEAKL
tara:strand:- start:2658 stop:4076 length:1419 start_codon:yes stop_codon:yes gene_type:complete